jgi:EAL domain-containing protein (putative c-di-GMP-specific phosphodiesterase class I)
MMVHIDRFNPVTPVRAQGAVNEIREALARRLTRRIGQSGSITHLGGNLLAIVEGGLANVTNASNLARSLQETLSLPYSAGGTQWQVETSLGTAVAPHDGEDPMVLLTRAELLMAGTRPPSVTTGALDRGSPLAAEATATNSLVDDLRVAISRGEGFSVVLQPIVRLSDGFCLGFEALARWNHPQHGEVSPSTFGPLSEDHGLIHLLSARVFAEAAQTFAELRNRAEMEGIDGHREWFISINVSPLEIMHGDIVSLARATLQRSGLEAADLEIEITESAALEGRPELKRTLERLREEGIAVAIDDFGTGYASLQRLARVNADTVKIDPSFVGAAIDDAREAAIIDAIIALAKSLGSRVIAEGIESPEQLALLRSKGCELGQGFLFLPPRPVPEILKWLRSGGALSLFKSA